MKPIQRGIPRYADVLLAVVGLIGLSPFMGLAALLVKLSSQGPILFRQQRVGLQGRRFTLYKFRSMRTMSSGPEVTAEGDERITRAGKFLRKTKIDELPELWNVLRGDMSFVGPRPEVERYVDMSNRLWRAVLSVRPGITDPVTLLLRNEEELLARVEGNREDFYLSTLQPSKLKGYVEYNRVRTGWSDVKLLFRTLAAIVFSTTVKHRSEERPN